jgi:hypothetical protein
MFKIFILSLFMIITAQAKSPVSISQDFMFGIANAPGHVEDQLDDIWMDFGRDGNIKAFQINRFQKKDSGFGHNQRLKLILPMSLEFKSFAWA